MRSKLAAALVVLAVIAGCDAFEGESPGPVTESDAGPTDAGAPEAAAADAALPEVLPEAGPDASLPATGCARFLGAVFCDDFESNAPKPEWQAGGFGQGVTASIGAPGFSGNSALVADVPVGLSNAGATYNQNRTITSRIRLRGEVRVPKFGKSDGDYVAVMALRIDATPQISVRAISRPLSKVLELSVVDNGNGVKLADGVLQDFSLAAWTPVELEVVLGPDIAFTLRGGGLATTSKAKAQLVPDTTNVNVSVGIPLASSVADATQVLVDDVAIWTQ